MMSSSSLRLLSLGLVSMGLATGCCCFESCHCSGKAFHRASEMSWNGTTGCGGSCQDCVGSGCTGVGCGCECHGCGLLGPAMGWCPDYPAMAAGWTPCCGPIVNFFIGLRNAFATCGCGCGPLYLDEWYNDPPACHDPCPGAYGPCGCSSCSSCGSTRQMAGSIPAEAWPTEFEATGAPSGGCDCDDSGMSSRPSHPGELVTPPQNHRVSNQPARPSRRRPVRTVSHQDQRAPSQQYRYQGKAPRREGRREAARPSAPDRSDEWDW
jgi:hypothetical protein